VHPDSQGALVGSDGSRFSACVSEADGPGCSRADHMNADTAKVNRYVENNWYSGGPVPTLFPRIAPLIGLRVKPIRDVEARFQFGFSLTEGFFFALSGNYKIPDPARSEPAAAPATSD
jgi:hypothetical protein